MNTLRGNIIEMVTAEDISLVKVKSGTVIFTALIIEDASMAKNISIGKKVAVNFKETEVMVAKPGILEISVQNKIPCTIKSITVGKILCQLALAFDDLEITSIITSNAFSQLKLTQGEKVIALIKTNEISLSYYD